MSDGSTEPEGANEIPLRERVAEWVRREDAALETIKDGQAEKSAVRKEIKATFGSLEAWSLLRKLNKRGTDLGDFLERLDELHEAMNPQADLPFEGDGDEAS